MTNYESNSINDAGVIIIFKLTNLNDMIQKFTSSFHDNSCMNSPLNLFTLHRIIYINANQCRVGIQIHLMNASSSCID